MAKKRLGEILLEDGLIDEQDLAEALKYKEQSGYRLGTALVALRIIGEWQLTEALGKTLELPVVDLVSSPPTQAALRRIPARLAERFDLVPLHLEGQGKNQVLVVAMSDPLNRSVIKRMEDVVGCPVRPVLAGLSAIQRAIRTHYHGSVPSQVVAAAERMRASGRITTEPSSSKLRAGAHGLPTANTLQGLTFKFRALLFLLLKKKLITEKEFITTLRRLLVVARKG
jgi:type IV pilus assembly protein PilB